MLRCYKSQCTIMIFQEAFVDTPETQLSELLWGYVLLSIFS